MTEGKALIFSAPSGSGKTTIIRELLAKFPHLEFSISATSRKPRGEEVDGKDYYFFSAEEFRERIAKDELLEWEEVYAGSYYGTLKSELERIWAKGGVVVFDLDVVGGVNVKRIFGDSALSLFIMPPSVEELRSRLVGRATDTPEAIERRLAKAEQEMEYRDKFDKIVINDNLEVALEEATKLVSEFIG